MALGLKYIVVPVALGAMLSGCAPEKPSEARLRGEVDKGNLPQATVEIEKEPVVVVDGEAISLAEFNRRLQALPEFARARFATIEKKKDYLNSIAQFEVMADEAERRGFGTRAEVLGAMKQTLADRLLSEVVHERLSMDDIDDDAVEAYYEANKDEFHTPAARRVALVEFTSRENAQEVRPRVLQQMAESDKPLIEFRKAAARYSVDRATGSKGGDVGFVATPDVEATGAETGRLELAERVWALTEKGEVTPVFAFDGGWALATFFDEREDDVTPLAEASGEIRNKLYEQRKQALIGEYVAELRQDAKIERLSQVLEGVDAPEKPSLRRADEIPLRSVEALDAPKGERSDTKTVPNKTKSTP